MLHPSQEDGAMRDFDLDPTHKPPQPPNVEARTPATEQRARPAAAVSSATFSAASLMHLQRMAGNQGVLQLLAADDEAVAESASPVHDVVGSGGGSPLDSSTRSTMESAFGTSFEDVRVHTDDQASRSAESVGANAYTVGSDVVFKSGQYDPGSSSGQRTIAHELSHVVQQSQGPVDGSDAPGGIRVSDPSDRFEQAAEQTAGDVMGSVQTSRSSAASAGSGAPVAQLEEDASAGSVVQREQLPEDEEEPEGT